MGRKLWKLWILCIPLVLLVGCSPTTQEASPYKTLPEFLLLQSIEVTQTMDELAQSTVYADLVGEPQGVRAILTEIGQGEYSQPQQAIFVQVPSAPVRTLLEAEGASTDIPYVLLTKYENGLGSTLANTLNRRQGSTVLAAAALLSAQKAQTQPPIFTENTLVLLIYPGTYSSVVSFIKSHEQTLMVQGEFFVIPPEERELLLQGKGQEYLEQNLKLQGLEYTFLDSEGIQKAKQPQAV